MAEEKKEIDEGCPAFPRPLFVDVHGNHSYDQEGMTLRDYFAGQFIAGLAADSQFDGSPASAAKAAYQWADEMIEARRI